MSIDKQVFVDLVGELETYYKREFTPFVKRVWYKHLSDCLTTSEFVCAVEQVIVAKEFMPTPQQIVEAVKGDEGVQAQQEWEVCVKAAVRAEYSVTLGLTPQGKFALRAVGGVSELGRTNEDELRWLKKEFISTWKGWKPPAGPALLPAQNQSALPQASVGEVARQMRELSQKMTLNSTVNSPATPPGQ